MKRSRVFSLPFRIGVNSLKKELHAFSRIRTGMSFVLFFSVIAILGGCGHSFKDTSARTNGPVALADHWKLLGEAINKPGYDIWGCSPVYDDEGKVHLFAARWKQSYTFEIGWRYESEIAHYVSDRPEGPFSEVSVIGKGRGPGHWNAAGFHNPGIRRIDNRFVLVYIANDGSPNHGPNQQIGMMISSNPYGPWIDVPGPDSPLLKPPSDSSIWCFQSGCGVNNPSLLKHPDGRYFLYFKAMTGPRPAGKIKLGVAIADKLEGPYVIYPDPITENNQAIEDGYAFIWRDHICLLTTDNHGIIEKGGGLLWVSKDGLHFDPDPLPGFHHLGNFYYGGQVPETARVRYSEEFKFERPQLLMSAKGELQYMYCPSGVAIDGSDGTNCYVLKFEK